MIWHPALFPLGEILGVLRRKGARVRRVAWPGLEWLLRVEYLRREYLLLWLPDGTQPTPWQREEMHRYSDSIEIVRSVPDALGAIEATWRERVAEIEGFRGDVMRERRLALEMPPRMKK